MRKAPEVTPKMREGMRYLASLGGKARAMKYSKAVLSKWAKLGGRPPKKGKRHAS